MCHQRGSWDVVITAIVMEGPVFVSRREETSWVSECLSALVLDLREQGMFPKHPLVVNKILENCVC